MTLLSNKVDTPAMIQHCLSCTRAKCTNCLGQQNKETYTLRRELGGRDKNAERRKANESGDNR